MKELLFEEGIDAFWYDRDNKEIEIMNSKFVDKSNGKSIMNKVVICTNTIQVGQSIYDNILPFFIQKLLEKYSSVEQFIWGNLSNKSITHLFLSVGEPVNKALKSDLIDRYYSQLRDTQVKALYIHQLIIKSNVLININGKVCNDGKRAHMNRLNVQHEMYTHDGTFDKHSVHETDDFGQEHNEDNQEFNSKPLNIEIGGLWDLL